MDALPLDGSFFTWLDRLSCVRELGENAILDTDSDPRGARTAFLAGLGPFLAGLGPSGPGEASLSIMGRGRRETCFIHRSRHDWDVCRLFLLYD